MCNGERVGFMGSGSSYFRSDYKSDMFDIKKK